jgi:hypothetical protein
MKTQAFGLLLPLAENILPLFKRPFVFAKLISKRNRSMLWALIQAQELNVHPSFENGNAGCKVADKVQLIQFVSLVLVVTNFQADEDREWRFSRI